MGKDGRERHGVTGSSVCEQTGLGFFASPAKASPFILKKILSPSSFFTPASVPSVCFTCQGHGNSEIHPDCTEKQMTHRSQQTGVSHFYLKTVLHYHLQRVRKGFPPCLEFIKASNMINNLYTWIVIQKKGIKAKDLTTPTFTIPAT